MVDNIANNLYKLSSKKLKVDVNIKLCEPRPMAIEAILKNSKANDYEHGRFEWELKTIVDEDSDGFSNVCQLCGNTHLKYNFIIYNPNTNKNLIVGSTCIVRFGVVKGNVDVESGNRIIKNFIKVEKYTNIVRGLIKTVMSDSPQAKDYKIFFDNLKSLLEYKNLPDPSTDQLGEICYGDKWHYHKQFLYKHSRLNQLWYEPEKVHVIRAKSKKDRVYKEGSTFGHKNRTTVYLPSAGRSSAYKTDNITD